MDESTTVIATPAEAATATIVAPGGADGNNTSQSAAPAADLSAGNTSGSPAPSAAPPSPEPEKPADPKAEQIARAFAALTRKERAIVEAQRKVAAEKAEAQAALERVKAFEAAREAARANPIEYLQQAGLSYDDLTQYIVQGNQITPEQKVAQEIESARKAALKAQQDLEAYKQAQIEAAKKAEEEAYNRKYSEFREGTIAFVKGGEYNLTKHFGFESEVPALIEAAYEQSLKEVREGKREHPVLLTKEEAAAQVEGYLEELTSKATASDWWAKKNAAKAPAAVAPKPPETQQASPAQPRTTLTNTLAAPVAKPARPAPKMESDDDAIARAVAVYQAKAAKTP